MIKVDLLKLKLSITFGPRGDFECGMAVYAKRADQCFRNVLGFSNIITQVNTETSEKANISGEQHDLLRSGDAGQTGSIRQKGISS